MKKVVGCGYHRDNELNERINSRYFPSQQLKPNFELRPGDTKYVVGLKKRNAIQEFEKMEDDSLHHYKNFTPNTVFYSGDRRPPVLFALESIDTESTLRNQREILRNNDPFNYIPSETSELFNVRKGMMDNDDMAHEVLTYRIRGTDTKKCNLAPNTFFNCTRNNIKNM